MFFKDNNNLVQISEVYTLNFTTENKPFLLQVASRVSHTMSLTVSQNKATMKVDGLEASYSKFYFDRPPRGSFSLVSNNKNPNQGGYRSIRLTSQGKTLLELDFSRLSSVAELEDIFDCYYMDSLAEGAQARKVNISDYWSLNDSGHLVFNQYVYNAYHHLDASNFCMLTLRSEPIGDFELTMEFIQSWCRYGVAFGCRAGTFPYSYNPEEHTYTPREGAFAYVEAEGYRTMRGNLLLSAFKNETAHIVRYAREPLPSFCASADGLLCSPHKPLLAYHIDAEGQYICGDTTLPLGAGYLTYLPARTSYKPAYTYDHCIVIEFEFLTGEHPKPDYTIPLRTDKIQMLFEELLLLQTETFRDTHYRTLSVFYQILAEAQTSGNRDTTIPELIRPSLHYMSKHFSDPELTITEVAGASNISEVYFRQIFKKATGQLPNKYILNLRINHAIFLLQNSKYRVNEIALKSGFSDTKYFMTVFKRVTGSSPQQYRRLTN